MQLCEFLAPWASLRVSCSLLLALQCPQSLLFHGRLLSWSGTYTLPHLQCELLGSTPAGPNGLVGSKWLQHHSIDSLIISDSCSGPHLSGNYCDNTVLNLTRPALASGRGQQVKQYCPYKCPHQDRAMLRKSSLLPALARHISQLPSSSYKWEAQ